MSVNINGIHYELDSLSQTASVAGNFDSDSGVIAIPSSILYGGISYNVTSIGEYAFDGCTGLTSITIPDSVTSIGDGAFQDTSWYDNQPDGVVYINNVLYKYKGTMPSNTSITIPEGVTSIGESAFSGCTGLTSITIPDSVTSIGEYVFSGCKGLTSITIPNSVTSIGRSAFDGCTGLTSIIIPNSVTSIGYDAFHGCTHLSIIRIPKGKKSIFCKEDGRALQDKFIEYTETLIGNWVKDR